MLHIKNFRISLGSFTLAMKDLNLSGKRNFIMGENGSGKTTLLKAISGIYPIDEGSIYLLGERVDTVPAWKREISYIPQDLSLFPNLNVKENLRISILHARGSEEIFRDVVKAMDLEKILLRRVNEISGGQAQRVAVARSLISNPKLILMDEPFSMQDERARISMMSLLESVMDEYDFPFIYVTHDKKDMELGFDTLTFINSGKLVESVKSTDEIAHFSSLSMLDYKNLITMNGSSYIVEEDSFGFSDETGIPFKYWKIEAGYVYEVEIGGEKFFISGEQSPSGRLLYFKPENLKQIKE